MPEHLTVGGARLHLPAGCTAALLSGGKGQVVRDFVLASPDHTVYHLDPYLEHARRDPQGGPCDLALVLQHGNPVFAIPIHVRPRRILTGYSGILLPPSGKEASVRRSIGVLGAFLAANPTLTFEAVQAAQAMAYDDSRRVALIKSSLAELALDTRPIFTRVLSFREPSAIEEAPGRFPGSATITLDCLDNALLSSYDGDARNQIKQALRGELFVDAFFGDRAEGATLAYELYQPLHEATWARAAWPPHSLDYWSTLSGAVNRPGGGSDLVVLVSDADGSPLAGAVCHRYRGRALYWSGCSDDRARRARANPLALHSAITACSATGTTLFEIGRFDAREWLIKERAVTQYKSQFRGDLLEVINFGRFTMRGRVDVLKSRFIARASQSRAGTFVRRARAS